MPTPSQNLLFHGTRSLSRVLRDNTLLAFETDDGQEAVSFSRDPRTAAFFASGPDGGLLVFCRARLTARTRLRGYHMGVLGFCNRSEGHSEHEERALGDVHRIDTTLVWVYDMASIPSDWRRRPTVATGPVPLPWVDTPCTGMAA